MTRLRSRLRYYAVEYGVAFVGMVAFLAYYHATAAVRKIRSAR